MTSVGGESNDFVCRCVLGMKVCEMKLTHLHILTSKFYSRVSSSLNGNSIVYLFLLLCVSVTALLYQSIDCS